MKIAISAESTIDLPKELLKEYDIQTVPFTVLLGEKMGIDGDITPEEIFAYVDKTGILPKTSAVNEFQFEEHFNKLLQDHDAVIHFSLSSEISSACENAKKVAKKLKNVYVIDSRTLSTGIALEAIYASKLAKEGLDAEEIVKKVEARIPHVQASFVVNTLSYLYKGGRCSSIARFASALFRIKPQIVVNNGKMEAKKKYHGRNTQVVEQYCKDTLEQFNNPDKSLIFITHSHATPDMVEAAKKIVQEQGFKNIIVTVAAATITSHCGPKTLGILYINDGMNK